MPGHTLTHAELLDAAYKMADTGRPTLALLLAEEAASRTNDPAEAARILRDFPSRSLRLKDC